MITCDKCGFGHRTFEEKAACKSWEEMQAEESASASPALTSARQFFMNDPRFRCTGTEPYTEYEMAFIEENLNINGIPVFEFAEVYAKHASGK